MFDLLNFERTGYVNEPAFVSLAEFARLPEYSHTMPTDTRVWKSWRRRTYDDHGIDRERSCRFRMNAMSAFAGKRSMSSKA